MKKILVVIAIFAFVFTACDEFFDQGEGEVEINKKFIGKWSGTYVNSGEEALVTLDITKDSWVLVVYLDDGGMTSKNGSLYKNGSSSLQLYSSSSGTGTASLSGDNLILNTGALLGYNTTSATIQFKKGSSSTDGTTLTIKNESSFEITDVIWNNNDFTKGSASIKSGKSKTILVSKGEGYIFFKRKEYSISARTNDKIVVEKDVPKEYTINDNTLIFDTNNPSGNAEKLNTLGISKVPQITVKAGNTTITPFGDYDFGSVLLNTYKDITFTIGNSGKADLKFNVVEGNVINLSNNASDYFSVNQQPFASMTIAPESTTTFAIRFSPKTKGTNFNAEVMIKTNSENNAEFTFRVKGNGSSEYKIGDTGPGGGIIFFAQGGQYKECSGELGAYNWADADNQARNYRGNGFINWRLPDRGELDLLYGNRTIIGGFLNAGYWSSTEYIYNTTSCIWIQNFGTSNLSYYFNGSSYTVTPGSQDWVSKSNSYRVRAVRSFSL